MSIRNTIPRQAVTISGASDGSNSLVPSASRCVPIVPHDTDEFPATAAIQLNEPGMVTLRFEGGSEDVELNLLAGVPYPYRIVAVRESDTDPDLGIHGLY